MALGTSPLPLGAALQRSAEAGPCVRATIEARWQACRGALNGFVDKARRRRPLLVRGLASLYLLGLVGLLLSAFGMLGTGSPSTLGLGQVHVAFLMLAGAGVAVASLKAEGIFAARTKPAPEPMPRGLTGLGDILAQMSHELRTPLNAVIGFSEVMRHELHGPLNARYQEYAIHICESGDRMLKSSQDALAVAEAMTVLLAPQPVNRKESVHAGALVLQALPGAGLDAGRVVVSGTDCQIHCEARATLQALEHLLREAALAGKAESNIEVQARRHWSERTLQIRVPAREPVRASAGTRNAEPFPAPQPGGLNLLLARLLLEAQGARVEIGGAGEHWQATVTFRKAAA